MNCEFSVRKQGQIYFLVLARLPTMNSIDDHEQLAKEYIFQFDQKSDLLD